jgi:hypothetical protein
LACATNDRHLRGARFARAKQRSHTAVSCRDVLSRTSNQHADRERTVSSDAARNVYVMLRERRATHR